MIVSKTKETLHKQQGDFGKMSEKTQALSLFKISFDSIFHKVCVIHSEDYYQVHIMLNFMW